MELHDQSLHVLSLHDDAINVLDLLNVPDASVTLLDAIYAIHSLYRPTHKSGSPNP